MPMRNSVCRAIITATAVLFLNLGSARADDAQALKDRLHATEKDTSLNSDDVAPFYLKMSVQLSDPPDAPSQQGTIEIYWGDAKREKLVYTFPSYSATEVHVNGARFRTPNSFYPPAVLSLLVQQTLHPMPRANEIDSSSPQLQKITLSKLSLDCITLAKTPNGVALPPLGASTAYCLGSDDNAFRLTLPNPGLIVLRNAVTTFQQRQVAFDLGVTARGVQTAEAKISTLEQRTLLDSDFSTDGLPLLSDGVPLEGPGSAGPVRISAGVMQQGLMLTHVDPVYPPGAKMMHVQGTVVLHAQIGADGHIHALQAVSSPDKELSAAAMDAVRQWTYRPYMLNGSPVAVDTTINVNFTFGGR